MMFTTNHDEKSSNGTVMDRYGKEGHRICAVLAYTLAGRPLLYSGQDAEKNSALAFIEEDTIEWGDYSLQGFYTKLLELNRDNEALWNGGFVGKVQRISINADQQVYAFTGMKGDDAVVVVLNFSAQAVNVEFGALPEGNFEPLFDEVEYTALKSDVELSPFAYHVFHTP